MYSKIGNKRYDTKNTTPESLTLQKTFKKMVDEEVTTAVMEVSSHALVEGRVMAVTMILLFSRIYLKII